MCTCVCVCARACVCARVCAHKLNRNTVITNSGIIMKAALVNVIKSAVAIRPMYLIVLSYFFSFSLTYFEVRFKA